MSLCVERLLFICSANLVRSATAEHVARLKGYLARSAGTAQDQDFVVNPLTKEHLQWATKVVCMMPKHVAYVEGLGGHPNIVCWEIEDIWGKYMHPDLVRFCEEQIPDLD